MFPLTFAMRGKRFHFALHLMFLKLCDYIEQIFFST